MITPIIGSRIYNRNIAYNDTKNNDLSYANKANVSFAGFNTRKINPVYPLLMKLFNRSIIASRRRFVSIVDSLQGKVNEVTIFTKDKKRLMAWDIRTGDSDKYVLYFHGASQNVSNNQTIYETFLKKGYNVLAGEYRGFGKNKPSKADENTIYKDVTAMQEYLIKQGVRPENIGIAGHSLGGFAATIAAEQNPKAPFLILLSPVNSLNYELDNFLKRPRIKIPKLVEKCIKIFPQIIKPLNKIFRTEERLSKISIPTFIIHASNDKIIPFQSSKSLSKKCKNLKDFVELKTGGHGLESSKIEAINKILNSNI